MISILVVTFFLVLIDTDCLSQNTNGYQFDWTPNPSKFIKKNYHDLFTKKEYVEITAFDVLGFETLVDIKNNTITEVKYSEYSSEHNKLNYSKDLSPEAANKLVGVLKENINITKIKVLFDSPIPDEPLSFMLSLYFTDTDRDKAKKWK